MSCIQRLWHNCFVRTFQQLRKIFISVRNIRNIYGIYHNQNVNLQLGTSVLELVVVLGTSSAMLGMAVANYDVLNNPLQNSTNQTIGFFKQVRAKAVSSTSAYRVEQLNDLTLITKTAPSCDSLESEFFVDTKLSLEIEKEVRFVTSSFSLCFNARGFADTNKTLPLITRTGILDYANVVIPLGGGAKIVTY